MADDGLRGVSVSDIHEAESKAFAEQLNKLLRHDEELKRRQIIPILDPYPTLIKSCRDGVLLAHMINKIQPDAINIKNIKMDVDVKKLNIPGCKDAWEIANNNNQVLEGAKALGCKVVNIGHEDLVSGNVDLILGLLWQLIRAYLMKSVNLASHPELIRLMKPNENILKLMNLSAEEIIIRWFNYHLARAGSSETVRNFGSDMKDCSKWVTLLKQVCGREAQDLGIDEVMGIANPTERAQRLLDIAEELECCDFTSAKDIVKGHARLNLAFTATIFNEYIGIRLPTEDEIDAIYEQLEEVRKQLGACQEDCKHKFELIEGLQAQKEALAAEIKELERLVEQADTDLVVKDSELRNTKREKTTEINRLNALIAEKRETLASIRAMLQEAAGETQRETAEKRRNIAEQQAKASVLETELAQLDKERQVLAEQLEGRGGAIARMTDDLLSVEAAYHDKTRITSDVYEIMHAENTAEVLKKYNAKLRKPQVVSINDESEQALEDSYRSLEQILTGYILEINEVDAENIRDTEAMNKRLADLNDMVKEFAGEGSTDVGDGIANLKRVIELMIAKCNQQTSRMGVLEAEIKMKKDLADVMGQKVRVIAETAIKTQTQKKKSGFFS